MLLIDGARYELWTPPSEDEFEEIVKEHTSEIFGENSTYIDIKRKVKAKSGIAAIPDGYVIIFGDSPQWHIIETELSSHPLYEHIVPQLSRFINSIKNPTTINEITRAIYDELTHDEISEAKIKKSIGTNEIYKFVSELLSKAPIITVVIEEKTPELDEALSSINHPQKRVIEFKTLRRFGAQEVHAHYFEPVKMPLIPKQTPTPTQISEPPPPVYKGRSKRQISATSGNELEITIKNPYFIDYHLFQIPLGARTFFPGYKIPFTLETDIGSIQTYVTSSRKGTQVGEPLAGVYFQSKLSDWYRNHPEIKVGDKVKIKATEPMKRYRLEIVK